MLILISGCDQRDDGPTGPEGDANGPIGAVVFTSERASRSSLHLFTMNPDGTGVQALTAPAECPEDGGAVEPRWSPDGRRIAFVVLEIYDGLHVIDGDGSNCRRIFDEDRDAGGPSWSPDGSRVAFCWESGITGGLSTIRADGTDEMVLAQFGSGSGCTTDWSPDGRYIAFVLQSPSAFGSDRLRFWDTTTGELGAVAAIDAIPREPRYPAWSPDGSRIAFVISGADRLSDWIVVFDFTDGSISTLDFDSAIPHVEAPRWSPDGTRLIFDGKRGAWHDVLVVNTDGTGLTNLTNSTFDEGHPDWRRN